MFQPDFIAGLRRWSFGVLAFIFALFLFFSSDHVSVYQVENEMKCDSLYHYASGNTDEGSISSDDLKNLGAERSRDSVLRTKRKGLLKMIGDINVMVLGSLK